MRLQLAVIALLLVHQALLSQANPDSVKLRNDCRAAEHVLTTGEPGPHRTAALSIIGLCGREGIPALQAAWTSAGGDRTELGLLVTSTRAFVAPELVEMLFTSLSQPSQAVNARVASLLVLLTYADAAVVPGFDDFIGDEGQLLARRYGRVDHPSPALGREQLAADFRQRLGAALQAIAASDPDAGMRLAARVALQNPPLR